MPRTPLKRALGSLRRLLRRRRAPGPREQEWLRLILLVRKLQRGQFAVAQRLDEIRALTAVLGSFRSDFGALHEQLGAARDSAAELERGLSERLAKLDALPDAREERAALDQRIGSLDEVAARLERLAAQAPSSAPAEALDGVAVRLEELTARLEAAQGAERVTGGQDELAHLYERILELAEGMARRPRASSASRAAATEATEEHFERFDARLDGIEQALQALGTPGDAGAQEQLLARLERLAGRLEGRGRGKTASASNVPSEELIPLLARVESLAVRLEQVPVGPPERAPVVLPDPEQKRELDELRVNLACELESRRRVEGELDGSRERLRASELARVELESRHTTELAQMADHVGRQLARVEEDLKKKKRGLAELTQQNIALQNQLTRLTGGAKPGGPSDAVPEPPPALPRSTRVGPRLDALRPDEDRPDAGSEAAPEKTHEG